jgi:lipid II isoglutaminyl synthase (glutamine-hydrolysing)
MHGPCLARNPELADLLLSKVVGELAPLRMPEAELLRREQLAARCGCHSRSSHL